MEESIADWVPPRSGVPIDNLKLSAERRERAYRETSDVSSATRRLILAIGRRVAEEDPEDLEFLIVLGQALNEAWSEAIAGLRASGHTDTVIGQALGTTKQNVQKRWPRQETCDAS